MDPSDVAENKKDLDYVVNEAAKAIRDWSLKSGYPPTAFSVAKLSDRMKKDPSVKYPGDVSGWVVNYFENPQFHDGDGANITSTAIGKMKSTISLAVQHAAASTSGSSFGEYGVFTGTTGGITTDQQQQLHDATVAYGTHSTYHPPVVTGGGPAAPMFTLIRGADTPDVYVLNNRGERFHVTEKLMNDMIGAGAWPPSGPEVRDQASVDALTMRYTVDSIENLGTINGATVGDNMMLVKGDAAGNPDGSVLVGNGNAVYIVNSKGEKAHVTEASWNDIVANNGGVAPDVATITQTNVDAIAYSPEAAAAGTTDPVLDAAVAATTAVMGGEDPSAAGDPPIVLGDDTTSDDGTTVSSDGPASSPVPASSDPVPDALPPPPPADESLAAANSGEGIDQYTLIQGIAGSAGTEAVDNSILKGNNNAVYAVNSKGQKFHVTGELKGQMEANGTWQSHPVQMMTQEEVDRAPDGSSVSLTNMGQLRSINIGTGSEFRLVKGRGFDNADDNMADGNSRAVFALTSTGEKYHVSADLANKMGGAFTGVEEVNQSEIDSYGANKKTITTIKELNEAVKNKSGAGGGFAGDTSLIGGAPAIQGYASQP